MPDDAADTDRLAVVKVRGCGVEGIYAHDLGGMYEPALTDVHPHMRDPLLGAVCRGLAPEQKIPRKKSAPIDFTVVLEYSYILSDPCLL